MASIFCQSVSSDWQIVVDSSRKSRLDSSKAAFGLAPSSQPRYLYLSSHLRAGMGLEPSNGSKGSTYFLELWFTMVRDPHLAMLKVMLAHCAKACTLSKTGVSLALSSQRRQRSSAYASEFKVVSPMVYPWLRDSTPRRIPSMKKLKRMGLSGQPCLTPFPREMGLLVVLPTRRWQLEAV